MQPTFVGERHAEDLRPEAVGGHHRVRLLRLGWIECTKCVGAIAILKQRILHRGSVNRTQQCRSEHPGNAHRMERV
jgi:hypothetical protein